ncbi:hypothetical protein U1Q18_049568, partial [Sarracenia purpurea var. burkii]
IIKAPKERKTVTFQGIKRHGKEIYRKSFDIPLRHRTRTFSPPLSRSIKIAPILCVVGRLWKRLHELRSLLEIEFAKKNANLRKNQSPKARKSERSRNRLPVQRPSPHSPPV